jgi:hypothetical protein
MLIRNIVIPIKSYRNVADLEALLMILFGVLCAVSFFAVITVITLVVRWLSQVLGYSY